MIVELWTRERNVEHVRGFSHDLWNVNARDLSDQCDERERETEKCFIKSCFTRSSSTSIIRFSRQHRAFAVSLTSILHSFLLEKNAFQCVPSAISKKFEFETLASPIFIRGINKHVHFTTCM